ncbi:MAG: glycosyl hydrolase [Candidatus Eremiobacteraeota bacterium]|nr:glycosyl hydrolase [Candidatus Eremiobacteraeota bacterium]
MKAAIVVLSCVCALAVPAPTSASDPPQSLLSKLHWRSVGPYVGGRVVAVAGVPSEPNLFYMGAVDGGIWKSTDYGLEWTNISDGTLPGDSNSIGAIAVAPSNANVIYVGTGESDIRADVITGDGVFKSTDAGKKWQSVGLRDTHSISGIAIDPRNADVAYVSAMGHVFKGNTERGVYKTTDGGRSWKRVLFVDNNTGAIGLSMDASDPATLYAAMWQAERHPWKLISGGRGSGLYKTTDGGAHWTNLSHNPGYPRGVLGRLGVAVAPSNPRIVYSIVQAKDGGVFRSDDGGATWKRSNDQMELRQRAFYYMAIYVDPTNPNTVWVPNVEAVWKSTDGGKSFIAVRPPHGDNHIIWIDPHNPKILLEGNDGGATVSTDGGNSWSTVHNQPTGQFYHISLDNQFPFHIYGAQQDEGSTEGPSASVSGTIGNDEWRPAAYGESTFVAPQPDNPNVTYGSGYFSIFLQYDSVTGQLRSVSPYPYYKEGAASEELRYRWGWTHPILFSPANPKELLIASQYVQRSDDYGLPWQTISPDLTRNDKNTEGPTGGPVDLDQTNAEVYPDISSLAVSLLDNDVLWAGSADGLVHVTTDGGLHWSDVTPPALPQTAQISSIEPSHVAKGAAYLTASRYMWDDFHPYVYQTNDYGAHWTPLSNGVPNDQYAFAIRQDPAAPNLLFLGMKSAVYVSFDSGASWQPLSLNLPKVQVRDIAIDEREGEVAIATHGRAFWLLDNLALLEQLAKSSGAAPAGAQVFAPQTVWLTQAYGGPAFENAGRAAGENPPFGATVFFNVPKAYNGKTAVALTFADAAGNVVRTFSLHYKTKPPKDFDVQHAAYEPAARRKIEENLHTGIEPRMNRFQWDLRYAPATDVDGYNPPIAAGGEDDTVDGPTVVPGTYTVTLDYGGAKTSASFGVALDPRLHASPDALQDRLMLQQQITAALDRLDRTINDALALRDRLTRIPRAGAVRSSLDAQIGELVQLNNHSSEGTLLKESKLHDHLAYLNADIDLAWEKPTAAQHDVWKELSATTDAAVARLQATIDQGRALITSH